MPGIRRRGDKRDEPSRSEQITTVRLVVAYESREARNIARPIGDGARRRDPPGSIGWSSCWPLAAGELPG